MLSPGAEAELDLRFFRMPSEDSLYVELRGFEAEATEKGRRSSLAGVSLIAACDFDLDLLRDDWTDFEQYSLNLTTQLFGIPKLRAAYDEVASVVESREQALRLRLIFDETVEELHGMRWELLQDPRTGDLFSTSEKVYLCRFLYSSQWRPVRLRRRSRLRTLAAVAAPDLSDHGLAEIDGAGELEQARQSLDGTEVQLLGNDTPCSATSLIGELQQGFDVLYLMCHGELSEDGDPRLMLEDDSGGCSWVDGGEVAAEIGQLEEPPRLVVLASCQSAGRGDGSCKGSLARRLVEAGVPAVVAMQGNLSMKTAACLLPIFFSELVRDGRVDRALAVARGAVREQWDAWKPVLYLRLRGGKIWYEPGFGGDDQDGVRWQPLASSVMAGEFTPIVGWGFAEGIYGSPHDLARRLAGDRFPMAPDQRCDLPQVMQYLQTDQSSSHFALESAKDLMRQEILLRRPVLQNAFSSSTPIEELLTESGRLHRQQDDDPYRILAALPARVYINASSDSLLVDALREVGRNPEVRCPAWRDGQKHVKYDLEPTIERPLVYQIFGSLDDANSLVLTEDDYFEFLIGFSENRELVPPVVRNALASGSLLFLGFQLTDWSFRVLYRLVLHQGGGRRRDRYTHAAVQVDPDAEQAVDVDQVRRYLETYFGSENICLFWGSSEDFLVELEQQMRALPQGREVDEF